MEYLNLERRMKMFYKSKKKRNGFLYHNNHNMLQCKRMLLYKILNAIETKEILTKKYNYIVEKFMT